MTTTLVDSPLHILALGGIDHTYRAIKAIGHQYSLIQSKFLVTDYQISSAENLYVTDYQDVDAMVNYAKTLNNSKRIDCVLCMSEYPQLAAAAIADALGVESNCATFAVKSTRNKYQFRQLLDQNHLPNVHYKLIKDEDDLADFIRENENKAIIKPVYGAGSIGVQLVTEQTDLAKVIASVRLAEHGEVLAEAYIEGREYSVESMSINGLHEIAAITEKVVCDSGQFVELAHVQPAIVDDYQEPIKALITALLDALQHKTGPSHTEIKITDEGIQIIESQVRLGGDQIWEMTMWTSGVDVTVETVYALIGKNIPKRTIKYQCVAIQYFNLPPTDLTKESLLAKYHQIAKVDDDNSGIIRVEIEKLSNNEESVTHSGERSGYVLVYANSADEAKALAQTECEKMQVCMV